MKQNYQLILDRLIQEECANGHKPTLLLHACCAPCSSYVLEYLSQHFAITLLFYNPNIAPEAEYRFRAEELKRLVSEMELPEPIRILEEPYVPEEFFSIAAGLEELPEGGARCARCYQLRLGKCAALARQLGFDFFTTTLSISPYKNAEWLNEIGIREGERQGVRYLVSDFKKRNGYKRSCELSAQYGLYRQDYCGCIYSQRAAAARSAQARQTGEEPPL